MQTFALLKQNHMIKSLLSISRNFVKMKGSAKICH